MCGLPILFSFLREVFIFDLSVCEWELELPRLCLWNRQKYQPRWHTRCWTTSNQTNDLIFNDEQPLVFLKAEESLQHEDKNEGNLVPFPEEFLAYRFSWEILMDLSTFICLCYTFCDELGFKFREFMYSNIEKQIFNQKKTQSSEAAGAYPGVQWGKLAFRRSLDIRGMLCGKSLFPFPFLPNCWMDVWWLSKRIENLHSLPLLA